MNACALAFRDFPHEASLATQGSLIDIIEDHTNFNVLKLASFASVTRPTMLCPYCDS